MRLRARGRRCERTRRAARALAFEAFGALLARCRHRWQLAQFGDAHGAARGGGDAFRYFVARGVAIGGEAVNRGVCDARRQLEPRQFTAALELHPLLESHELDYTRRNYAVTTLYTCPTIARTHRLGVYCAAREHGNQAQEKPPHAVDQREGRA